MESNNIAGFHVICGTSPKNGINGTIPGIVGCADGQVLDLSGLNSLLVADLDYFIAHKDEIVDMVKDRIECRDNNTIEEVISLRYVPKG